MSMIDIARRELLEPCELTEARLMEVLSQALDDQADDGDIYLQALEVQGWTLEDGHIKEGDYHTDRGLGIRVVSGDKSGFVYSNELDQKVLKSAAQTARSIVRQGASKKIELQPQSLTQHLYGMNNPLVQMDESKQVAILQQIDRQARQLDHRIKQVDGHLVGSHEIVLILDAQGRLQIDVRPLVRLNVQVIAEENGRREQGHAGGGGRYSFQMFLEDNTIESYVRSAVHQALTNLEAKPAPAGTMPVVLGPGWPGVLLHEAVGHGLEADFNRKGSSAFSDRIGEVVASDACTVVDNGAIEGRRGSMNIDDEGTPTQETVLIENGVLKGYMQDKLNARLMGMKPTGNGRRESYAHLPIPRMTNTYLLGGQYNPEEVIGSVDRGIYAVNFSGGQVEISSGKFVFSASEAYLIEKGRVTAPIKNATLIGNGPEVLKYVSMVGHDLELDPGIGVCGKDGQGVPVGVGQPTVKVDQLTVGGSQF